MRSVATMLLLLLAAAASSAAPPHPDGEALYGEHCGTCHGMNGHGDGVDAGLFLARPRDLREGFVERYDDDELVDRILRGTPLELEVDPQAYRRHLTELDDVVAQLERIPDINWKLSSRARRSTSTAASSATDRTGGHRRTSPAS
jgi:hypothetical protein